MNTQNLYNILTHLSALSLSIPFILSVLKFKVFNKTLKTLFIYLVISVLSETVSFFLRAKSINNFPVLHIFSLLECLLIMYMYHCEFKNKAVTIIVIFLALIFSIITAVTLLYDGGYNKPDNITDTLESAIIIGFSISFFYKLFKDLTIPKLTNYYFFWLNTGFLFYFGVSFSLFISLEYIEQCNIETARFLWAIQLIINIFYNVLMAIGLWKTQSSPRTL